MNAGDLDQARLCATMFQGQTTLPARLDAEVLEHIGTGYY